MWCTAAPCLVSRVSNRSANRLVSATEIIKLLFTRSCTATARVYLVQFLGFLELEVAGMDFVLWIAGEFANGHLPDAAQRLRTAKGTERK